MHQHTRQAGSPVSSPAPERRAFLLAAAAAAATAAAGCTALPARPARGIPSATPSGHPSRSPGAFVARKSPPDWAALRRRLVTGEVVTAGDRGYAQARRLFDPRFDGLTPAGIAYCAVPADVAACLTWAATYELPFRVRSGGHSYAGWSSVDGGLVIDISKMSSLRLGAGTVTAGAGIDLINLYDRLASHGLAIPAGSCPTVGLAGLALGGGVGVLSRVYGLTCDNVESLEIVTASGQILNCDATEHSDLYWACRGGGGGNFGVVTSFTLRTRRLASLVLFFLNWPWSTAGQVVAGWQSWAPHAPDALWSNMHLSAAPGGSPVVSAGGTYVGGVASAQRLLDELYAAVGSAPSSVFLRQMSFRDAMLVEAGCSGMTVSQCDTRPGGTLPRIPSYAKSDFFTRPLAPSGIGALTASVERMTQVSGTPGGVGAIAFDALGGAVNAVPPDATAFVHRDALFLAQYSTSWDYPGQHAEVANQHAWLRSAYSAMHRHASGEAYQNYIDPDLTDWRQAYYGGNYARLARVKATYDPHGLFTFPQAITPA